MPERRGRCHSRQTGAYYTPAQIAEYITEQSMKAWISRQTQNATPKSRINSKDREKYESSHTLADVKILDPAVGDGVFLIAAANHLLRQRCKIEGQMDNGQLRASILANNLFGVDLRYDAIQECRMKLVDWAHQAPTQIDIGYLDDIARRQIRKGNSLVGTINDAEDPPNASHGHDGEQDITISSVKKHKHKQFFWNRAFPSVFEKEEQGFDIIVGNPPFGNILTASEKEYIRNTYDVVLFGGRTGTWNIAAQFLARASSLLKPDGEIAFVLPNSIMRTKQFSRTRKFLAGDLGVWKIVDEGSPFEDVTLEMVSVFCSPQTPPEHDIAVISRRANIRTKNQIPRNVFQEGEIAVLYHDDIFQKVVHKGDKGEISATRGRDIPSEYVNGDRSRDYRVPYASSGRSVKRYRFDRKYFKYTKDTYLEKQNLDGVRDNEFLLATKNKAYPRCVLKPKGMIHGGGVVRIDIHNAKMDAKVLGLLLNSRMIRYFCVRYLTNYSRLTTCLNTGIIEELPIVYPDIDWPYRVLFDLLHNLYQKNPGSKKSQKSVEQVERIANALVYDLYLEIESPLRDHLSQVFMDIGDQSSSIQVANTLASEEVNSKLGRIFSHPEVVRIERSPRME